MLSSTATTSPRGDLVAGLDRDRDDDSGAGAADEAAIVPRHPVWDAVDLDQELGALGGGDGAIGLAPVDDASLVGIETFHLELAGDAVRLDPEALRADLLDAEAVPVAAVTQIDRAARSRGRPAGRPRRAKAKKLARSSAVTVSLVSIAAWRSATSLYRAGSASPPSRSRSSQVLSISPDRTCGWSSSSSRKPWLVVPSRSTTIVSRNRASQARQGFVTIVSPGDHLGDHRVELGGDRIALGDPCVDPQPRARSATAAARPGRAWARSRAPDPRRSAAPRSRARPGRAARPPAALPRRRGAGA